MSSPFLGELSGKNFLLWLPLKCLSFLYSFFIRLWLLSYRIGIKDSYPASSLVVSIGNITVGGTGKTPLIDWCLQYCQKRQIQAAVLTRGYKSTTQEKLLILDRESSQKHSPEIFGDEPWLLHNKNPDIPIYISPDRVSSAKKASTSADVLFLDDGMQHLKLQRDGNLVLIDSTVGIGNGQILPLGPLREPLSSLKRADAIIYTRTNLSSSKWIREKLSPYIPDTTPQFDSEYVPVALLPSREEEVLSTESIRGRPCFLFSGIGNPQSFLDVVKKMGATVIHYLVFSDHQNYDSSTFAELERCCEKMKDMDSPLILTTEKDWTKVEKWKDRLPNFYRLQMQILLEEDFIRFFSSLMEKKKKLSK